MKVTALLIIFIPIIGVTLAWRSQSQSGSSGIQVGERGGPKRIGGDRDKHKSEHHANKQQQQKEDDEQYFNIGLIVPHTNFGKRKYQGNIGSAVASLQKMRDTKLPFLRDFDFTSKNVHFDMILLTPSPTSEYSIYNERN